MSEKDSTPRKNADTRKAELNREIRDLLAQRDALKREVEGSARRDEPAPEKPAQPSVTASTIRPDLSKDALSEGEFFAQFEGAPYGDYTRYIARYEAAALRQSERATEQQQSRDQAFSQRMAGALAADRDLLANVPAKLLNATRSDLLPATADVRPMNIVAQEIYESAQPAALIRHFKDHPDELDALDRLPNHAAVVRAVAKIEAKLDTPSVPVVTVKTTSSAPPPPTTLGRKPAPPVDEVEAAVKARDFSRYRELMNSRELAAAR